MTRIFALLPLKVWAIWAGLFAGYVLFRLVTKNGTEKPPSDRSDRQNAHDRSDRPKG